VGSTKPDFLPVPIVRLSLKQPRWCAPPRGKLGGYALGEIDAKRSAAKVRLPASCVILRYGTMNLDISAPRMSALPQAGTADVRGSALGFRRRTWQTKPKLNAACAHQEPALLSGTWEGGQRHGGANHAALLWFGLLDNPLAKRSPTDVRGAALLSQGAMSIGC